MRYIDDNSGITFNNVKKIGSLIENCPSGNPNRYWYSDLNNSTVTGTDDTFNSINPNILGVINAIDIDWNEALVEDHVTVSTTGELISWIKTRPSVITLSFNPKILIATVNGVNIYIPDFQSLINAILARIAELEARVRALENGSNVLKITITFNGNGGTIYGLSSWQRTISLGEEIGTLPVAERSGYNFNCWKTLNGEIIYNSTVLNEDTTLYAQWEEATPVVTQYTVRYYSNGGNSTPASQTVNAGETVTLAGAISRNADSSYTYSFKEWNENSGGTAQGHEANENIRVNNNINLYAQWNKTPITPVTPTTEYYFSVGTTAPTASNYTTVNNATTTIPTSINFSTTVRGYGYILAPSNKNISIVDKSDNAPIPFTEQTSVIIDNHKVYKTNGALAVGGTIKITLS